MRVVGILLVKDEDLFVETAVRNVLAFCDEFIAVENGSKDGTAGILDSLALEFDGRLTCHRVDHPRVSHELIAPLAGSDTWVFAVDGDEIYDPAGLVRLRVRLEAGEFDRQWVVFGNVLNVRHLDPAHGLATGHLAPPCRSMTKLYNFSAIEAWRGPCHERLHGGTPVFRAGYHENLRCDLHQQVSWENADFRCLHLCFLRRSSLEPEAPPPRRNIMDRYAQGWRQRADNLWRRMRGQPLVDWKEQRYGRGPLVTKDVRAFFPERAGS